MQVLVTLDVFWAERVNLQEKYDDPNSSFSCEDCGSGPDEMKADPGLTNAPPPLPSAGRCGSSVGAEPTWAGSGKPSGCSGSGGGGFCGGASTVKLLS